MNFCKILTHCYKYKRKIYSTRCNSTQAKGGVLKLLFFGTDNFSLPSLKVLHKNNEVEQSLGVVTSFKNPANCVRVYAEQQRLPLYRWPISAELCKPYDLGVVVSFGHMIPTHIINAFPLGMINVHASLLPRWRGAAPIIYAIMNGDRETGVSIMRIEPNRFDVGDIFAQRVVPIKPDIFMPELHNELSEKGADLLWEVVAAYPNSFMNPIKQSRNGVTYAPKITPAITKIDWEHMTARQIYDLYRSLYGYKPLTAVFLNKSVELLHIRLPLDTSQKENDPQHVFPGSLTYCRKRRCLRVQCAKNTQVEILSLRVEGRKAMTAMDFNNGFLRKLNSTDVIVNCNKKII